MKTWHHCAKLSKRLLATLIAVLGVSAPAFADLHIKSVERAGTDEAPVTRGETVNLQVSVYNDGAETAFFSIVQVGGCSAGEFFNIGDEVFVKDGDTKTIEFPLCINQEAISGRFTAEARFSTSIFLRDVRGGGVPLFGIIRDSTPDDNWATVSFPAVRLRNVTVTLDLVVVRDTMDSVSVGDWHVIFSVANFAGAAPGPRYGRRIFGPPFPNETDAQNVSTDETVTIGRSVRFASIAESEDLVVEVFAIDCDGDTPLLMTVTRFGGALDCYGEEEFWELSGDHDVAGPSVIQLRPAGWLRGSSFGPARPLVEFTPTISIVVE